jgi:peptide/nickel transport system ATP-binding protein
VNSELQNASALLLSVRDLRISFGEHQAVRSVSFDIAPGETLGLVGESGSGKSATALAMMRLLPPSAAVSGSVGFCGEELLTLPEDAMRRHRGSSIAMIFQEPMTALNPVMKVGRQIAEALLAHAQKTTRREIRERVLAAMREVGLPEPERRCDDYPHQFSGGQRQRIVIAMALMNRPGLIIADEPTTALDVTVQAQVLELLKKLRADYGCAMLFISHDLAVVAQVADRVAVMRHGEIVELGSVHQVMTQPKHPYTRSLLASAPTLRTDRERPLAV